MDPMANPIHSLGSMMANIDPIVDSAAASAYHNYNLTSSMLSSSGPSSLSAHHQHQPQQHPAVAVKLENNGPTTIPLHPAMPSSGRGGVVKYCGVCGDIAKSYHFGGLSCDSCKAFFRRSVQNDNYLHFQCCHRGQCVISLSNRKSCQYCRMKRCFAIGMEKSWVMTEEERKALMKARAEKKSCKRSPTLSTSSNASAQNLNTSSNSSGGDQSPGFAAPTAPTSAAIASADYEPHIERMIDFMAPLEIKEIESIVTKYMHAYQHVPYRSELRFFDSDRPGVQVMEMFGTLIRRFAFFSRMMADFSSLPFQDQSCLLKGGVLEMCLLRGALVFDPETNRWPTANMSMYKDMPVLKLDNIVHLTSSRLFQMHLDFISCIRQMSVDEPTIMLLILIVLFTPERAGLIHTDWIEKFQSYYTSLLEHYLNWRFGLAKAKFIFGKMLTKLSDLRELSDTHNHANLRLGTDEVSSIQSQLNSLKLNPYPELKVVHDGNETPLDVGDQPSFHDGSSHSPTLNAKVISSRLSDVELGGSSTYQQPGHSPPFPPSANPYAQRQPPQLDAATMAYQQQQQPRCQNGETNGFNAQQLQQQQHQAQQFLAQSQQQIPANHPQEYQNGMNQQQQPPGTNMAMQFMQAMQQSVSQVANAPHFGYEWVKPNYQFDPLSTFYDGEQSLSDKTMPLLKSSSVSESPPLTDRELDELYEVIDEYTDKDLVQGRILQAPTSHVYSE